MEETTKPNAKKRGSTVSLIGLILAIIAVLLSAVPIVNNFAFVLAILALILGSFGLAQTKHHKRRGRGMAVTAVVLAIIGGVVVLASQQFYSKTIDDASKAATDSIDKATGNKTDQLLGHAVTVDFGAFKASKDQYGVDATALPVKVTNKEAGKKSYSVEVEAVKADGSRIANDTVYVDSLGGGQSQQFKAFQYVESDKIAAMKSAEFKVVSVSQY